MRTGSHYALDARTFVGVSLAWTAACHDGQPFQLPTNDQTSTGGSEGRAEGEPPGTEGAAGESGMVPGTGGPRTGGATPVASSTFPSSVGRLSRSPTFCWIRGTGALDQAEWESARDHYQSVITQWEDASGLTIRWRETCESARQDRSYPGDVRILLEDRRELLSTSTVVGCGFERPGAAWAIYPEERESYRACQWNMVLPLDVPSDSTVLHVAGHALGFSHEHLRETDALETCPDESESRPTNPYLARYDSASAMHYGRTEDEAYGATVWSSCEDLAAGGLSSGDRLAIEMIYPKEGRRTLGATGWLLFGGVPTFRNDYVILASEWRARGGADQWFGRPRWYVFDESELFLTGATPLFGPRLPEGRWTITHVFTDPFGDEHDLAKQVNVSTAKHTAVLMSLL